MLPLSSQNIAPDADAIRRDLAQLRGQRVAVALSGGVDSAAAALALVDAGAEVVGLTLRLHDVDPLNPLAPRACCAPDDVQDARHVAEVLQIPFYVIDARDAFEGGVVKPFVDAYLGGRTPNPCVGCNSRVKLGLLARRARALGCARLATGHYARLVRDEGRVRLFKGRDPDKDQSYFLFATPSSVLADLVLPLGAADKTEVRDRAMGAGLPVAHKLDSQEVCFVGGAGAGAYVAGRPEAAADRAGEIVDREGAVLGSHSGIERFTVGQRRGLGLGTHRKLYVLQIEPDTHQVVVGDQDDLDRRGLSAKRASWPHAAPAGAFDAVAKIRYRDPGTKATVAVEGDAVNVQFHAPVRADAPGQAVVFHDHDEVIGGAWIERSWA